MTEFKHWSEYLLPIPTTVSIFSILALSTAQFEKVVHFGRPVNGWEYLKWDEFAPNLVTLQNLMIIAFETSDESMLAIYSNSQTMNEELRKLVEYAGLDQDTPGKLKVKQKLMVTGIKTVQSLAVESLEEVDKTIEKINATSNFIGQIK